MDSDDVELNQVKDKAFLNLKEAQQENDFQAIVEILNFSKNLQSKNLNHFKSSAGYEIVTEKINKVKFGSNVSYSFLIIEDSQKVKRNIFRNLVLERRKGEFNAYIVTYLLKENGLLPVHIEFLPSSTGNYQQFKIACSAFLLTVKTWCSEDVHYGHDGNCKADEPGETYTLEYEICSGGGGSGGTDTEYGSTTLISGPDYITGSGYGGGGGDSDYSGNDGDGQLGEHLDEIDGTDPFAGPVLTDAATVLINILELTDHDKIDWLNINLLTAEEIMNFYIENDRTQEAKDYANAAIEAMVHDDFTNFFSLRIFNGDPYDVWGNLSQEEKDLIISFPYIAYEIFKNRKIAEDATKAKFGFNGRNDKSDAFRHAYFNAITTMDVGAYFAELFANAHESEVPSHLFLEKQMDLFNNSIGHNAQIDFTNHSDSQLVSDIYQALWDGDLRYLSPLGPVVPPNFGINSMTQLIPTDQ